MMWLQSLLQELNHLVEALMKIDYVNQSTIFIAKILAFHGHTNHVEVGCHYIRHKVLRNQISTTYISTLELLEIIFTKGLIKKS